MAVASVQAPETPRLRAHIALGATDKWGGQDLAQAQGGSPGPAGSRGETAPGLRHTDRMFAVKREFADSKARFVAQRTALGAKLPGAELAIASFAASLTATVFVAAMQVWMHSLQAAFSADEVMATAVQDAVNLVDHIHEEVGAWVR